jgi:hypothetical protein
MPKNQNELPDELEENFQRVRRLLLEEIHAWIESLSEEERNTPHKSVGGKVFTPLQVLHDVEEATQYGRLFVERYSLHLLESAKLREE